ERGVFGQDELAQDRAVVRCRKTVGSRRVLTEAGHDPLPQSAVTTSAPMAKDGVIPLLTARGVGTPPASSRPENRIVPAPEAAVPTLKWVRVLLPPVQAGNSMTAALDASSPATDQPAPLRATATRS